MFWDVVTVVHVSTGHAVVHQRTLVSENIHSDDRTDNVRTLSITQVVCVKHQLVHVQAILAKIMVFV